MGNYVKKLSSLYESSQTENSKINLGLNFSHSYKASHFEYL